MFKIRTLAPVLFAATLPFTASAIELEPMQAHTVAFRTMNTLSAHVQDEQRYARAD